MKSHFINKVFDEMALRVNWMKADILKLGFGLDDWDNFLNMAKFGSCLRKKFFGSCLRQKFYVNNRLESHQSC